VFSCLESEIAFEEGTTEFRAAAAECQRLDDLHHWWNDFREETIDQLIKQVGSDVKEGGG
jgi:uncharacterized lipoprotein YddW (UPF0748 family)